MPLDFIMREYIINLLKINLNGNLFVRCIVKIEWLSIFFSSDVPKAQLFICLESGFEYNKKGCHGGYCRH